MVPIPMKKLIASAFFDAAVVRNTPIEEHSVAINVAFYPALTQKASTGSCAECCNRFDPV